MVNNSKPVVIIGVGNTYRGDDGIGPYVIKRIKDALGNHCEVREVSGEGAELMGLLNTSQDVHIVDAVRSGAPPGTLHVMDALNHELPGNFFNYSSHAFSLAEAVEMSRVMGTLPPKLTIYGIEGHQYSAGTELSALVRQAGDQLCGRLIHELERKHA